MLFSMREKINKKTKKEIPKCDTGDGESYDMMLLIFISTICHVMSKSMGA